VIELLLSALLQRDLETCRRSLHRLNCSRSSKLVAEAFVTERCCAIVKSVVKAR